MIKNITILIAVSLIVFFGSSCLSLKSEVTGYIEGGNCIQLVEVDFSNQPIPDPISQIDLDSALIPYFSYESLNIANAIGLLDLLSDYLGIVKSHSDNPSVETRLARLEVLQEIYQKINVSSLELSAVASEVDCEEERLEQIANYLNNREKDLETKLTVGAITVGALAAIGAGILMTSGEGPRNNDNIEYIGIAAGITEATLGVLILTTKKKVTINHKRNALREIWEGKKTSQIFPPSVWYYLNNYDPERPEIQSKRYLLQEKWMGFEQIADASKDKKRKARDLYFSEGGKYSSEQLYNRASMYDQLEAQIKLMKQDLNALSGEIEKIR